MRTRAWAALVWSGVALGCTANTIDLDDTSGTGTDTDATATVIPDDDSTGADDGPLECLVDADCGDFCSECVSGSCQEYPGCCAPMPDDPWVWRCSPPEECFGDRDCPSGWTCDFGSCVPAPDPVIEIPPECKDPVELITQSLDLGFVASQVLPWGGSGLLVADEAGQLVPVDLVTGPGAPLVQLRGLPVHDLVAVGSAVIGLRSDDVSDSYELLRAQDEGGTWVVTGSESAAGVLLDAAVLAASGELVALTSNRIDRWSAASLTVDSQSFSGLRSITTLSRLPGGPVEYAGVADDGLVVIDPATAAALEQTDPPAGTAQAMATGSFFLRGHGQDLVVLGQLPGEVEGEPPMTVVSTYATAEGTLSSYPPFGVTGEPHRLAVADVDHDGDDDVIVDVDADRVELFLMEDDGVHCHVFLPVSSVVDLTGGDVDGDGTRDVVFSDASGGVTILWGSPKPG